MATRTAVEGDGPLAPLWLSLVDTELAGFGRHSIADISNALVTNTTVNSFRFNSCELNDADCAAIMRGLTSRYKYQANNLCVTCRPRTKRICFARNNIGVAGAYEIAMFLITPTLKSDSENTSEACAKCGNNRLLSPRFMEDFIRIELLSNNVGDEGVTVIANAISSFATNGDDRSHYIVELGFERNAISDAGMVPICQMLKTYSSLHTLHLGRNDFTPGGMVYLADALKCNKNLTTLNLSGNSGIGDEGTIILAESLKYNTSLKTLLLKKCGLTEHGYYQLIQAVYNENSPDDMGKSNHTLVEISVCSRFNHIALDTVPLRTLLNWHTNGPITAQRLKLVSYLRSDRGIMYVHSLGFDRKLFPFLLRKLWRIFREDYLTRRPANKLEVLWNYIRGMPHVVQS
jgi:hypothetical protein